MPHGLSHYPTTKVVDDVLAVRHEKKSEFFGGAFAKSYRCGSDKRPANTLHLAHRRFDRLQCNVSRIYYYRGLLSARDCESAWRGDADIPSFEPAVFREARLGGLRVMVIARKQLSVRPHLAVARGGHR